MNAAPYPASAACGNVESGERCACCLAPSSRDLPFSTELQLRRQLSFSEDSDLSSDDVLERSSQKSRREVGSQAGGLHGAWAPLLTAGLWWGREEEQS